MTDTPAQPVEKPKPRQARKGYRSTPGVHATLDPQGHLHSVHADELEARRAAMDAPTPLSYAFIPWGATVESAR